MTDRHYDIRIMVDAAEAQYFQSIFTEVLVPPRWESRDVGGRINVLAFRGPALADRTTAEKDALDWLAARSVQITLWPRKKDQ